MAENRADYALALQKILTEGFSFSQFKDKFSDKSFANMLFMTTFRQLYFIKDEVLPQFVKKKIPQKQQILQYILFLGASEILFLETPDYAVINSYVEAAKKLCNQFGGNFVNAVLRHVAKDKGTLLANRQKSFFPPAFIKILKQDYTAQAIAQMEQFVTIEPPLDITLRNEEDTILDDIGQKLNTGSVRLPANTKVNTLKGYEEGLWWVQDISSSLAVRVIPELRGKKVLDLCAAPGGKTAQLLGKGAMVTALDISESRLSTLKSNIERLHLEKNLTILCKDALNFVPQEKYDVILLDAPCSATGTFRRHPEILHTKTLGDVKKQASLQKSLLEHICSYVVPNGLLIYATCSLSKIEGEVQINQFLRKHSEYHIVPISKPGFTEFTTKEGYLRLIPKNFKYFSGADGFFIACLQRKN
jgi:16S rRNA (cytosine967-C5)-methyltransferase